MSPPPAPKPAAPDKRPTPSALLRPASAIPRRLQRMLVAGCALLVALLWTLLGLHLGDDRARELRHAEERLDALVGNYAASMRSTLALADFILGDIAHEYRDHPLQIDDALARARESVRDRPAYLHFAVADTSGRVAHASTPGGLPFAVGDREYFQYLSAQPGANRFITRPFASRLDPGRQLSVFARRIADPQNVFLGIAMAGLDLDFFGDFYRPEDLGRNGVVGLIGTDRVVRAYRTGERMAYGAVLTSQDQLFRKLDEAPAGRFVQLGPQDSVRRHHSYRALPEFDLIVVAGLAENEILAAHHRRIVAYVAGALALSLLAFLGTRRLHAALREIGRAQDAAHCVQVVFEAGNDPAVLFRVEADGRFIVEDANDAFARISGLPPETALGRPASEMFADETRQFHLQMLAKAVVSGEAQTYSVQQNTPTPSRSLLVKATPIADRDGVVRHVAAFAVDVSRHREGEARLRLYSRVLAQTASAVMIADEQGDIEYVNAAFETLSGYALDEVRGQSPRLLRGPDTPPERIAQLRAALARGDAWRGELCNRRKDGTTYWVQASISPVRNEAGAITHYVSTQEDISELRVSRQLLRLAMRVTEQSGEGVMITDMQDRIVSVNPAFTALTGYAPGEVIGRSPKMLSSGLQGRAFYEGMWRALLDTGQWAGEIWNRRKDGRFYAEWLSIAAVRDERGRPTHYVAVFSDITAQKHNTERLEYLSNYDGLTDLPNRHLLVDRFRQAIARAEREPGRLGLMLIDLDDFRALNERAGHGTGDLLLIEIARRIRNATRRADTVSRLNGDQFAVLIEDLHHAEELPASVERLIGAIARPIALDGTDYSLGACIGLALYPGDGLDPDSLLRSAEGAMRQAKAVGRNSYQYATPALNRQAHERLLIERHLRHALERNELSIAWQPQVDLASGRLTGLEALLRWRSAALGEIAPGRFIPIAEQAGLMIPIGYWVLQEISAQTAQWCAQGLAVPRVGINFTTQQLRDANLAEALYATLGCNGGGATRFEIEVAESALAQQPGQTIALFGELRRNGLGIAIDDFGAGAASLAWLARFPLDTLKIDRSFVHGLPGDPQACAVARAAIAVGRSLGLTVLAEGVENPAQADWLRAAGCAMAQGWLFGREVPGSDAGALLLAA